jgi:hypothetical protein
LRPEAGVEIQCDCKSPGALQVPTFMRFSGIPFSLTILNPEVYVQYLYTNLARVQVSHTCRIVPVLLMHLTVKLRSHAIVWSAFAALIWSNCRGHCIVTLVWQMVSQSLKTPPTSSFTIKSDSNLEAKAPFITLANSKLSKEGEMWQNEG